MSGDKQIKEMSCKQCIHYEGCLKRFREAKKNGQYELIDEEEYFAHADECDMFITGYRKASEVAREFRQRMNEKMGKHTHLLGKEYVQRIMREIEKEYESEGEE